MKKRFTGTDKWHKPWFQGLSLKHKLLWVYLYENCDAAGVWEPNYKFLKFLTDEEVTEEEILSLGADKIEKLPNGKFWLSGFISFQYKTLSIRCIPHRAAFESIKANLLPIDRIPLDEDSIKAIKKNQSTLAPTLPRRVPDRAQDKDRDKDRDRKEGCGEKTADPPEPKEATRKLAGEVLAHLNAEAGREFRDVEANLKLIGPCLERVNNDVDGVKRMVTRWVRLWRGTESEKYLQPSTLFNGKFDERYDQRDMPVQVQSSMFNGSKEKFVPGNGPI